VLLDGLPDEAPGPEARYEIKESISLAFVTALQQLPPRQRATLVLRDVLGLRTKEVADILDCSNDAVASALKRARATLAEGLPTGREQAPLPGSPREHVLLARFVDAFERGDIDGIASLLTDDVRLTMPPLPLEYQGRAAAAHFLWAIAFQEGRRTFRLVPTRANNQPAFGCYHLDSQAPIAHAHALIVLTLEDNQISACTGFLDKSVLPYFGLPRTL
jgi:RNA polymerase sigma-70 factor (ECF subfamily)